MATYKNIILRKDMDAQPGKIFANVHVMIGYCPLNLPQLKKMADMIRDVFPQAKYVDIEGGHIVKSTYCQGFTIVMWNGEIDKKNYSKEWRVYENWNNIDYYWK